RIGGAVDLGGCQIRGQLTLVNAHIEGTLFGTQSGRWILSVRGGIDLSDAHIVGDANFTGSYVTQAIDSINSSIDANLLLSRINLGGALQLSGSRIGANLDLTN